ncbi:nicotinate-nucleotide--dimethylbenzimidazole phosphoribosyltransferase [Vibrio salinus]|uniref:nicotinate-nucleotide--dimethylbenzimidazole phosphoribosyltransferase n=1 Tax=Vibrio salinus TaxID=2899784 RepID=UPI001E2E2D2C|nr:nicotinate-nucleotide--dimethylbenzimidazole phosphoribosyltransferase [Vibrio salinus]MCE0496301.1 nicotinate-nucleotide--dimethylbenzimidazole phosphoribosyltransferase [Vibrio salinus]
MLETKYLADIKHRIDQKTKPLGSLGILEQLATKLALIQSQGKESTVDHIDVTKPTVLVFAGDHGVADEGVSIAPSEVTYQMVMNFLAGGAGVNCFCRSNDVAMKVIDCGIMIPVDRPQDEIFVLQRLGERTENFAHKPAMTSEQVKQGLDLGERIVADTIESGSNLVMFGEMGIANTTSAAAILASITQSNPEACVGLGTGINPEQYATKLAIVTKAAEQNKDVDLLTVLANVGGYEIVQMVGAFLGAGRKKTPVLVDGFIVTVSAYVASLIEPECREYMIFSHQSEESGHKLVLSKMEAKPLLSLGLRLGEGTGAVLAVPLLRSACEFYNTMASFDEAGVTV